MLSIGMEWLSDERAVWPGSLAARSAIDRRNGRMRMS
jgi:hypothetical protein